MPHDYTLQPHRPDRRSGDRRKAASNPPDLTQTAFRCGSWSLRGPESDRWRNLNLTERAVLVLSVAALAGLGLAGLAVPVLLSTWLLRALGVLS